ncbi:hypothetical protein [Lysobacter antibioticus]|uniref:Uncharacterized protein n=1 Tax=Lysobacter antibioticus TaxID=84531 RepID=A0A0S2F7J9_LYSAN|nr:hypothetical protein [Lysobacter antibioticus]ALN79514.1 hypothetical protein LA76x_1357 [Lysobacter antibioticus]
MAIGIPSSQERLIDIGRDGVPRPTAAYFRFWQALARAAASSGVSSDEFRDLLLYLGSTDGTLSGLPPFSPGDYMPITANVQGDYSVESNGILSQGIVSITLVNDEFEPLPTHYYGTGADGQRGYKAVADAFTSLPEITLIVGPDGVTEVSLTPVPDSGAGALLAITRNGFGQVTGTRTPSTDDLAEGAANLYFSTERAQDATGAAIAAGTGDGVTLAYDDGANAINATNTDKGSVAVAAHEAAADPHPQYTTHGEALYLVSLRF